ncbi:MAG: hypothetical protein ACYC1L_09780 [Alphaproteobacteria bacterium]
MNVVLVLGSIVFVAVLVLALGYAVLRVIADLRIQRESTRRIQKTQRTVTFNGKEYSVVTKTHLLLREKSTGRIAIVFERGWENDPTMMDGKVALAPRWIKLAFIKRKDGRLGRTEWRQTQKFDTVGTIPVEYFSRKISWMQSEQLIRFSTQSFTDTPRRRKVVK